MDNLKRAGLSMSKELYKEVMFVAIEMELSFSAIVRIALKEYLKKKRMEKELPVVK